MLDVVNGYQPKQQQQKTKGSYSELHSQCKKKVQRGVSEKETVVAPERLNPQEAEWDGVKDWKSAYLAY